MYVPPPAMGSQRTYVTYLSPDCIAVLFQVIELHRAGIKVRVITDDGERRAL